MKRKTNSEIIKRFIEIHGDTYDYSLTNYINFRTKVKIICKKHGIFEQIPYSHLIGRGCGICGGTNKNTIKRFIKKSKEIHGDAYDYSLTNYINLSTLVKIICKKHGVFEQIPNNHMHHKSGCPICANNIKGKSVKLNDELFIKKSKEIHGDTYDYSLVEYIGAHNKVKIICKKHGIFKQIPNSHLNGRGCNICNESKGETIIKKYFIDNNLKFIQQKSFKGCFYKIKLRFDFYLPDYNICVEYNGIQHYKPINFFGGVKKFHINNKRFLIKENYCYQNGIKLIIIKYNDDIINKLNSLIGYGKYNT